MANLDRLHNPAATLNSRAAGLRPYLTALAFLLGASVARGQWLETTISLGSGSDPTFTCYNIQNNKVYCANWSVGTVAVVDGATNVILKTVDVGPWPVVLCYHPENNCVYCANYAGGSVTVIDGATNGVIGTVIAGSHPAALCCNPLNDKVYCANHSGNSVTVIDGATDSVVATVAVGTGPSVLCCNPLSNRVYCANDGSNNVTVVAGATDSVVATVAAGTSPCAVCHNAENNTVYCANRAASVTVIDCEADSVLATVAVGARPYRAHTWIQPSRLRRPPWPALARSSRPGAGQPSIVRQSRRTSSGLQTPADYSIRKPPVNLGRLAMIRSRVNNHLLCPPDSGISYCVRNYPNSP